MNQHICVTSPDGRISHREERRRHRPRQEFIREDVKKTGGVTVRI